MKTLKQSNKLLILLMVSMPVLLAGCASWKKQSPQHIQNPKTVYRVPADGAWIDDTMFKTGTNTFERTGKMWLMPGTRIVWYADDPKEK